jgi:hypothetical protein
MQAKTAAELEALGLPDDPFRARRVETHGPARKVGLERVSAVDEGLAADGLDESLGLVVL